MVCNETHVYVSSPSFPLFFFFFFFQPAIVDFVNCEQCICVLFTVSQITLFSNFFIKNGSHNTIYTFKNYFATVFSVSVFSFSKNKLNPNTPYVNFYINYKLTLNSSWKPYVHLRSATLIWASWIATVACSECRILNHNVVMEGREWNL